MFTALADLGVGTAIDDFGTGYSSLAYLRDLPVDELKIDRSFVTGMHRRHDDLTIVRSMIDLGHNLGLQVVAEGRRARRRPRAPRATSAATWRRASSCRRR